MFTMSVPESRARLGYLLSEMLSLPYLPEDLHQAVTAHLQQQQSAINLFKPEYCLRLYPVLAELAELEMKSATASMNGHATVAEDATPESVPETVDEEAVVEAVAESTEIADEATEAAAGAPVESVPEEVASETEETPVESVSEEVASETEETPVESAPEEVASEIEETPETFAGMMPMAAAAEAAANSRTLW